MSVSNRSATSSFPGESGSNPLAPSKFVLYCTADRQKFRRAVGDAVFQLNTAVVALEQVAAGHTNHNLTVKWPVPSNLRAAADQSRRLLLSGVLVLVLTAFEEFFTDLARSEAGQKIPDSDRNVILKQKLKEDGKSYSVRERVEVFMNAMEVRDDITLAFVEVGVVWRNHIVHSRARTTVDPTLRGVLQRNAEQIARSHSGIDVIRMLEALRLGKAPTLKEVTTIIANVIRLTSTLDCSFVRNMFVTQDDLDKCAVRLIREEAELNPRSLMAAHAAGKKKCRSRLREILVSGGFREVHDQSELFVDPQCIWDFADMSRMSFAETFGCDAVNSSDTAPKKI